MNTILLFSPGLPEIIIIVLAIVLLFGGKKIPELMRGLGKGIREFNAAKNSIKDELDEGMRAEDEKKSSEEKN